ncbi:AAA family ATPase, partial [Patescibacteria group bacterium]|nr:AAA family ATPase [Patescibacteria group bacterium]MBU2633157.1 AAA family ATPase [Patescibacteria group bacterium]
MNHRNIVIFGEPTTGKSTIAKKLTSKLKAYKIIEASTDFIFPVLDYCKNKKLPDNQNSLISGVKKILREKSNKKDADRKEAVKLFSRLSKKYSPEFISMALEKIYAKKSSDSGLVFTGLRGLNNAKYFKKRGYFIVYLKASKKDVMERFLKKRRYSKKEAQIELDKEKLIYSTDKIEKEADLVLNTSKQRTSFIVNKIIETITKERVQECKKCINTSQNPYISFNQEGYCNTCEIYLKNYDKKLLDKELDFFKKFVGSGKKKYDIMVALSGGKDSSATLYQVKQMGFTPLAYTFDTGYFHPYIYKRAKSVAKKLDVDYKIIPVKKYLTQKMLKRFSKLNDLYTKNNKQEFINDYKKGRYKYRGVIRPCWVCRELIIHARYFEAIGHGVSVIATGLNEWTTLKQTTKKNKFKISALRKLKPYKNRSAVYLVHFPFLIQSNLKNTKKILKKINWNYYQNVQSNAASCLLAHAAEKQLYDNLDFHPDTTRLAREVTVGFLTKKEAKKALKKPIKSTHTIPEILKKAGLIKK